MLTELAERQRAGPPAAGPAGEPEAGRGAGGVLGPRVVRGYNANVLRQSEELFSLLREEGKTPVLYTVGRKALGYYSFRQREVTESWTGFSERPTYEQAREIADTLVTTFMAGADDEGDDPGEDGILGVDELHIVFTEFKSMLSQSAAARRIAPMVVEYVEDETPKTVRTRCFRSSRTRRRCSTLCCRAMSPPVSTPRCSKPRLRSPRPDAAR